MSSRLTESRALALLLRWRRAGAYAEATIKLEQRTLPRLLPRLGTSLTRATRSDMETLLATRLGEVKPSSVARELTALRGLYRVLVEEGLVSADPTAGLSVATPRSLGFVIPRSGVKRLLAEASRIPKAKRSLEVCRAIALRNRALIELLYSLGLRASEACRARLLDLDLADASLMVRRAKRGKPARLPLPPASIPHLETYLSEGRPRLIRNRDQAKGCILANERGKPLTVNHLARLVFRIAKRAEVEAHPHALRRSVATHLIHGGASLPAVQSLLGHRSLNTTQAYVGVNMEDLRAAVETLDRESRPS